MSDINDVYGGDVRIPNHAIFVVNETFLPDDDRASSGGCFPCI